MPRVGLPTNGPPQPERRRHRGDEGAGEGEAAHVGRLGVATWARSATQIVAAVSSQHRSEAMGRAVLRETGGRVRTADVRRTRRGTAPVVHRPPLRLDGAPGRIRTLDRQIRSLMIREFAPLSASTTGPHAVLSSGLRTGEQGRASRPEIDQDEAPTDDGETNRCSKKFRMEVPEWIWESQASARS